MKPKLKPKPKPKPKQGLVAILDALGAADYKDEKISQFLDSRERVLTLLEDRVFSKQLKDVIEEGSISTFTFNDTVLIIHTTKSSPALNDVFNFCTLLRKFAIDSLINGILFRGSVSVGEFYVDDESNTVMGTAVTDAAAWYDSADWIGINTTPHASLFIQSLLESEKTSLDHLLVDYEIPLKGRDPLELKAINWPKAFVVKGLTPVEKGKESPKAKFLKLLCVHGMPKGTELKYVNSVKFFDKCMEFWNDKRKKKKRA